ncbi:MAG: lipoyl synthase [Gammaproteobacteria bacterium]|nr:lipoyl synthase [Gammaproteobacteria bacterium]|tara:strand:+ start:5344 stop:6363 length:1020 start_codon:yes stop_codon:yes gene_type:complete
MRKNEKLFQGIPIVQAGQVKSGEKYQTEIGVSAVKNGQKQRFDAKPVLRGKKPKWLRAQIPLGSGYSKTRQIVGEHRLSTVCEESMCPNIGECWNAGTATIMVMGSVCTRACRFCAVDTGNPKGWLDLEEPKNSAKAVKLMGLKYVVITSVDRDDLVDGGALHYATCVKEIKKLNPETAVEALTPDFNGVKEHIELVVGSGLEVFAQNIETVERLTHPVRDPRAGYEKTIGVLKYAKLYRSDVLTKTSLMLGLGENDNEIFKTMDDLRKANVDILTLGQYLQPTQHHLAVERYVSPEEFNIYRKKGLEKGFLEVVAGPMVRSSYRAEQVLQKNNVGIAV